jgi:hypothetical protein
MMNPDDPSERFLRNHLIPIADTPERYYLSDEFSNMIVASWKPGRADLYDMNKFQQNAMILADLIKERQPHGVLVDCRHLGFELTYEDHIWYINQTRALWDQTKIKKIGFVFKDNLAVQMAMEELKEVAQEEGVRQIEYRIFECNVDAANWLSTAR